MSGGWLFAVFLLVAVGGGLLLYLLVRSEHDQRRTMDRESAEKVARRDTDEAGRNADRERERFS